jgi:hypothetical protein
MNQITTCLPTQDNDGNSVADAVARVTNAFADMALQLRSLPGNGLWRNAEGTTFCDPVIVLTAVLPETTDLEMALEIAKEALLRYKEEAAQESVVMAVNDPGVFGEVDDLIAIHGGCTQLSLDENGMETNKAFSFVDPVFL